MTGIEIDFETRSDIELKTCGVLDPFFGAGTTGLVAQKHGRNCVGIEINPDYIAIANERLGLAPVSALPHDAGQLTDIFS